MASFSFQSLHLLNTTAAIGTCLHMVEDWMVCLSDTGLGMLQVDAFNSQEKQYELCTTMHYITSNFSRPRLCCTRWHWSAMWQCAIAKVCAPVSVQIYDGCMYAVFLYLQSHQSSVRRRHLFCCALFVGCDQSISNRRKWPTDWLCREHALRSICIYTHIYVHIMTCIYIA